MRWKILMVILSLSLIVFSGTCFAQASSISVTADTATASDVPENASLIVGLYNGNRLVDLSVYRGNGTITGHFAQDMQNSLPEATDIKAFLWNMEMLTPLCNAFSVQIKDLPETDKENVLVVYYSRTDNTKSLAETVHSISGGDIVRIEPVNPYPEDYSACLAQVREEQANDYRPPIAVDLENVEQYDTILLGYPIWYNSLPTPVVTFLTSYDFSGKTIIPFCTSGSTGISGSVSRLRNLCPDSTIANGFRGTVGSSVSQVTNWLEQNGFYQ